MNKSEFTSNWTFGRRYLTVVILIGFLCSLSGGSCWPAGNVDSEGRTEPLAIHTGVESIRNYALTNASNPRAESNLARSKPVKQHAQTGALPERSNKPNVITSRSPFAGEVLLNKFSACCSQPQGRAPPLFA